MPSVNKQWSVERLGPEDYPSFGVHGHSWFIRSLAPYAAKAGDYGITRRGENAFYGKASAAIAAPTATAAVITFTVDAANANGLLAVGAIGTAGAGYTAGERVPVLKGAGLDAAPGWITVTTVNATGGITAATISAPGFGYTAGALTLAAPAMPWTLCGIVDAQAGTIGAGATHKSFAAVDVGEHGWIRMV